MKANAQLLDSGLEMEALVLAGFSLLLGKTFFHWIQVWTVRWEEVDQHA